MIELNNGPDKPHRKCARIVGDTMGKYHPCLLYTSGFFPSKVFCDINHVRATGIPKYFKNAPSIVEKVLYAINDVNLPFPVTFTQITWFVLTEFIIILFADVPPLSIDVYKRQAVM